jgi:hypothetical protein
MADVTDLEKNIFEYRERLLQNFDAHPKVAAVAAFDAVTDLLLAVVDELRETRLRGPRA